MPVDFERWRWFAGKGQTFSMRTGYLEDLQDSLHSITGGGSCHDFVWNCGCNRMEGHCARNGLHVDALLWFGSCVLVVFLAVKDVLDRGGVGGLGFFSWATIAMCIVDDHLLISYGLMAILLVEPPTPSPGPFPWPASK